MSNKLFTEEQMTKLRENPYVKHVSDKSITYTKEFKEYFYELYINGTGPTEIFRQAGFDVTAIGHQRIRSFTDRIKIQAARNAGFDDTRHGGSGRPKTKGVPLEEQLKQLKVKNKILQQENDFLKRVRLLNRQQISARSKKDKQRSDTN